MSKFDSPSIDRLFDVIIGLDSREACYRFFEDACTIKELQDMAQRLDAAVLLEQGVKYQEISEKIGISAATISRVSKCLNYGTGGYREALDRLKEN